MSIPSDPSGRRTPPTSANDDPRSLGGPTPPEPGVRISYRSTLNDVVVEIEDRITGARIKQRWSRKDCDEMDVMVHAIEALPQDKQWAAASTYHVSRCLQVVLQMVQACALEGRTPEIGIDWFCATVDALVKTIAQGGNRR
jgi:hypothetical protein